MPDLAGKGKPVVVDAETTTAVAPAPTTGSTPAKTRPAKIRPAKTMPASKAPDATGCTAPVLTQALLGFGDPNWYTMVGGESPDQFTGSGWTLTGGAAVMTTTLADGQAGQVLDLPAGSEAISPAICVAAGYHRARTEVRKVHGNRGVRFLVSYQGTKTWASPRTTGRIHGRQTAWTLSTPINIQASNRPGWRLERFAFIPEGPKSDYQLYDFWVDPRSRT